MKRLIFICFYCCSFITIFAQKTASSKSYYIKGNVDSGFNKVYLVRDADKLILDSSKITNGSFVFKGKVKEPFLAYLSLTIPNKGTYMPNFILENANYTIEFNFLPNDFSLKISGGKLQEIFGRFQDIGMICFEASMKINDIVNDSILDGAGKQLEIKNSLKSLNTFFQDEQKRLFTNYINDNPDSYITPCLIPFVISSKAELPLMEQFYNNLTLRIKNSLDGKALLKRIQFNKRKLSIGDTFRSFKLQNDNNETLSFSRPLKNKITLIDFWATWCGPCLKEMPFLADLYVKYHDAGFEIISISTDKSYERWLKSVKTGNYSWIQLIDNSNEQLANHYGIDQIPYNILLDENMKVIAENLHGQELEATLQKLLTK